MKKTILAIGICTVTLFACKKENQKSNGSLELSNSIWYGKGEKSLANGLTYYEHLSFKSNSNVDAFNSYLVGEETDVYTAHLRYTISNSESDSPIITITGTNAFGKAVNNNYTFDRQTNTFSSSTNTFSKFK